MAETVAKRSNGCDCERSFSQQSCIPTPTHVFLFATLSRQCFVNACTVNTFPKEITRVPIIDHPDNPT